MEAAPPSLYSPGASADPKFNKPLVDTTRTITVIPEQVIKDQGVTNLTDALKNVPGVGGVLCRGEWQLNHRGCHLYARRGYL
ncbi:ferrichrome-iron receptor [Klebsiella pneumoniae]|nr:ferrichrome-iron receptor [Klebsiella pneumoniae]